MSAPEEWGEPEPIGGSEDTDPFWQCPNPECSKAKATKAKARACCADGDGDSPDTDAEAHATDGFSASDPEGNDAETGVNPTTAEEISIPVPDGVEIVHEDGELLARQEPDPETGLRTDPAEFARYYDLLMQNAPEGYVPHLLRCAKGEKGPALQFGSWKTERNRLDRDEAIEWLREGGNVGIAGIRADPDGDDDVATDPLVNMDIDDRDAVPEEEVVAALGACSRSRIGDHRLYFDTGESTTVERDDDDLSIEVDGITNIAPDCGEIRTDTQYVVVPGSHVPVVLSDPDEPDLRDIQSDERANIGRYTVAHEQPAAHISYADLPNAYRNHHEEREFKKAEREANAAPGRTFDDYESAGTDPERERDITAPGRDGTNDEIPDHATGVYDLDITDATGLQWGYRGTNPIGHHNKDDEMGEYFVLTRSRGDAYDHKDDVSFTPASFILADAGERDPARPNGPLSLRERFVYWRECKARGLIDEDDPIPLKALFCVLVESDKTEYEEDDWVWRSVEDGTVVAAGDDEFDPDESDTDVRFGMPPGGYNDALDVVEDEYGLNPGREHIDGGVSGERESFDVKPCRAPIYDPVAVDPECRRTQLEGPRLEDWFALKDGHLMMWGDAPGDGKTTSAGRGLAAFDRPFVTLLPSHENCREYELDAAKPDVDLHHKGAAQPVHDCCMDAKVAADEGEQTAYCTEHGHPADWERMCPIYHLDKDHPVRKRYTALLPEVGVEGAHEILDLKEYDWHGKRCAWQESFDQLEDAERVVTVNNYLTQKTVRSVGDVILDDVQGIDSFTTERQFTVEDLTRAANRLDRLASIEGTPKALDEFARFAHDLVGALTGGLETDEEDKEARIEALDPPELAHEGWRGEPLAQAKLACNEAVVRDMKNDEWDGEPLCIDALLAAGVHAGLDRAPAMVAAALPATLDTCPRCETRLEWHGGAASCPACGWSERTDPLTKPYDETARAQAWLDHEGDHHEDGRTCLAYRALPLRADLPEPHRTLWLDATPTRELAALLFGIDTENVLVTGDEPRELNAEVTQIENGQYHRGTIARGTREGDDPSEYGDRLRGRFQTLIEERCRVCEQVLVAGHKKNRPLFDLPDNADWMHYHAGRGLDRSDYDAVVLVGAPHVPEDALRRDAELLAQGRDDVRVGGREFGTRRNEQGELDANPPLYRKYHYENEDGRGAASPTKGYSGMMGTLFRASREDELLQIGHRIRPGQAAPDEPKHIDLLTNVPTDLPVDTLTDLETLTEPLYEQANLTEGAMDMSAAAADALDRLENGRPVAGVRPDMLVETDAEGDLSMKADGWQYLCRVYGVETRTGTTPSTNTIHDWLDRLRALDLLRPEEYEQREGRSHSGSPATLNLALQYLSHNANFKVEIARRFRRFVAEGASAETWLDLLAEAFDAGDGVSGGHPPPDPT
jgi:hypothetical protein